MPSIDRESESFLTITQAAKSLPGTPHPRSVWRWVHEGVAGIRLETIKVGGRVFTTREAVDRFLAALNEERELTGAR